MEKSLKCRICDQEFRNQKSLVWHVTNRHEGYSYESYIIHFFFNDIYPTCKCGCGTVMKFFTHKPNFFNDYTTNHFPRKPLSDEIKEKFSKNLKQGMLNKYGVDNPMDIPEFVKKIANAKQEKYGDLNYNNMDKQKKTMMERHGRENPSNPTKMKETNLKKFGVEVYSQTSEWSEQVKKTKKEKYGDENYINIEKIKQTKLERYGYEYEFTEKEYRDKYNNNKDSVIQLKCMDDLGASPIHYKGYNYDMVVGKFLIEIDGSVYHPKTLNDMLIIQLTNSINDYRKYCVLENDPIYELIRIDADLIKKLKRKITFEDIWELCYEQDFTFDFHTKFMNRSTLVKFLNRNGKEKLSKYWRTFLRFVKQFQPTFPVIPTKESLPDVISKISKHSTCHILNDRTFNNNCSLVGVSYLKSQFTSYWKSSFKGSKSPIDAWQDDNIMERVIKYRIGLNNSGEVFDFSLHQLVRGLSASRHTVSFFKPILASAIYTHFLKDNDTPIVFDPCCGFGGRLLGYKSKYPNGTYIGCEPNPETFSELMKLAANFDKVYLYNCKVEDFDLSQLPTVDLTFTSIPYYDLETYSNPTEYKSFDDWVNTFLSKIKQCPNLLVNIPSELRDQFGECDEYFISTNTSHFGRKNVAHKKEYLLIPC